MCIARSVGRGGSNSQDDVKTVQILLNLSANAALAEDGTIGPKTIAAIEAFQSKIGFTKPDGRVDPAGKTLKQLWKAMPTGLSERKLQGIMIHATPANVARYYNALQQQMMANGINTPLRQAHFLAQIAHESGELRYSEEIASGEAYEGRRDLGNNQPGDGKRFKGRGLIQLTGRANYQSYSDARKPKSYMTDETAKLLATDPMAAVDVSCWYWSRHSLSSLADKDNVEAVTKKINGGYNGLDDRKAKLLRAKFFLVTV